MRTLALVATIALAACDAESADPRIDAGAPIDAALAASDGGPAAWDAGGAGADGGAASGVAPDGVLETERAGADGASPVRATPGAPALIRIEARPDEHITFFLAFEPGPAGVELEVLRWDGTDAVSLGLTDAGPGLRTLAVFDASGPRTFWARITAEETLDATLTITRVPFADGATCTEDCAHLLQLPLPNDPVRDGYTTRPSTVFRYQYGRRDLLMFVRHAAQHVAGLGLAPLVPEDLSQWDGQTPGVDVGAPRHASHQRGKDVDISLHGEDGLSEWRSYCTVERTADGRECVAGTVANYDARANAIWFGDLFATGRVTMSFLDAELIVPTIPGADAAEADGELATDVLPLFSDGVHLQHWPNHDNHIHVRVSEADGVTGLVLDLEPEAFEPP